MLQLISLFLPTTAMNNVYKGKAKIISASMVMALIALVTIVNAGKLHHTREFYKTLTSDTIPSVKKDKIIYLKSEEELEIIRKNGVILGKAHAEVAKIIEAGVTTKELDKVAYDYIKDNGGHPSFLGYNSFPASLCISVNEVVVHGIPSNRVLKDRKSVV